MVRCSAPSSNSSSRVASRIARRVFDRRYQPNGGGHAGRKGLGRGLIICRELIGAMGGNLWLESKVGRGSTFSFTLPAHAPNTGNRG